jgi:hypothetical protein
VIFDLRTCNQPSTIELLTSKWQKRLMTEKAKPSKLMAVIFTVAAACSLITSVLLLARGSTGGGLLAVQLLASMLLTVATIANWVVYFRKWVDFEMRRFEESATIKQ